MKNKKSEHALMPRLLGSSIFTDTFHRSLEMAAIVCELAENEGYTDIETLSTEKLSSLCDTAETALRGLRKLEAIRPAPTARQ